MENAIEVGVPPEEGKFCADCGHLIGVRYDKYDATKWNCGHPGNSHWTNVDLITGIKKRIFKFNLTELRYKNTVESAKANVCGPEGSWYQKYEKPDWNKKTDNLTIGGIQAVDFDETALKQNREAAQKRLAEIKKKKLSKDDLENL